MKTISPATVDVGMVRSWQTRSQREIARVAGPLPTGKTLIKRAGEWYCKQTPGQRELDEAEHFFLGGHEHRVSDDLYAEIKAALFGADCMPTNVTPGLYPAAVTFSSPDTVMGDPT